MDNIPPQFLEGLSLADKELVMAWWRGLSNDIRSEVITLWDDRHDLFFFSPNLDQARNLGWNSVPREIGGRFVPSDDTAGWAEWQNEYFDFLLNHLEVEPPVVRTFHIGGAGPLIPDLLIPFAL